MTMPKTLAEHRDYLYQIVRLQLFFLRNWRREHPAETLSAILRNRVDIYRKTSLNRELLNPNVLRFDCPEWLDLERRLEAVYAGHADNAATFEEVAFAIFKPVIDERVEKDYLDESRLAGYQCGSLRYNEYADGQPHPTVTFHIANALQPESFFADQQYLPRCFLELMRQTEEKYGAERLYTGSWLNSLPRWLELFPPEWQTNLSADNTDVQWHYGFWGQFITARGTFNYKYGEQMRQSGKLPFYLKTSSCSFLNMREHLRTKYHTG